MASLGFPALAIQQPEDPLKQVAQIEQIRGAVQQQEMGAVQLEQARAAQQSQQTLMRLYAQNNGDLNQTYADAAASGQVLPDHLLDFRTKSIAAQTQLAALQEKNLTNLDKMHDVAANELEAFKALPVAQRTPQALQAAAGRMANEGIDISHTGVMTAFQSLATDPSDANINNIETQFKGEQWLVDNELAARKLASTPTAAQAQAKTAAELDKVQTDALIAHQQLLSMPTPEEAAKSRWANLLKTQAETAAAQASTAKTKAETALIGTNPVIAFDPQTQQRVLTTMPQAGAKGFTNPVKATEGDIQKETDATKQFNDVQMNISRYRNAINALADSPAGHDTAIAAILADKKFDAGHLASLAPGASLAGEIGGEKLLARAWNSLSSEEQDAVTGYLRAKGSIIAFQKALTQTGRTSKEALAIEMQNLPSPLEASGPAMKQMDAFQENIDTASKGLTRVPWLPSPQEVRQTIEQERANNISQTQKANQVFQANQAAAAGSGQYRGGGDSKQIGQRLYDSNKQYIGTVSKLYPDGTFDLTREPINERLFAQ